ncbi:hypothetical protein PCASD_07759 [Puccinia coronata f. sp. avenae]|uniref:Uncharacterized protein n=1 Tax=Puccinia coronata f. sp. avenae TaxID=200324 RepID=A0A2N5TBI6_9BASI|nr:hypothetical protein PCASD_16232 [Puccinia coronata f. sp. avenae]PLW42263.1 hypothetical protein PCASD_07759 [Puccinia coronata f. sp. avenae]
MTGIGLIHWMTCISVIQWMICILPGKEVDLPTELVPVPARKRSLTSPPSWYLYQPGKEVDLPIELPGEEVDNSSVRTSTSSPGWYREQLGMQVSLLAGLVPVPAQGVGQPTRWTGTGTSLASRLAYLLGGYLNLAIREPTTIH